VTDVRGRISEHTGETVDDITIDITFVPPSGRGTSSGR
jgi:hypothetical protein